MTKRTNWNGPHHGQPETFKIPSKTVPDGAIGVRELLVRHTRGLPLGGQWPASYDPDDSDDIAPDFKHMDLAERQEWAENAANELAEINNREKQRKAHKTKKEADEVTARVNDALKAHAEKALRDSQKPNQGQ